MSDASISGTIARGTNSLLRQGVEMRGPRDRYQDTQPKMWVGVSDGERYSHTHPQLTFGIGNAWSDHTPFDDRRRDLDINEIVDHMHSGTTSISVAFAGFGDDDGDIESFNGVIEPLEIRTVGSNVSGSGARSVAAVWGGSSRGDPIKQLVELDASKMPDPFVDMGANFLLATSSYTALGGFMSGTVIRQSEALRIKFKRQGTYMNLRLGKQLARATPTQLSQEEQELLRPTSFAYDDSMSFTQVLPRVAITAAREHFRNAFLQMTGSATDSHTAERIRYAGHGSTQHQMPAGTDSIAFGGLIRYKVTI